MPVDVLLHQQHVAGVFGIDARDDDVRVAGEVLGEALDVARLGDEVGLALERARELRGDFRRPVAPRLGHLGLDQLGHAPQQAQVGVDLFAHARPSHLKHHRRAVLQLRAVHLRDRRRTLRARVDVAEHVERRAPERAFELGQQLLERHRRHLGLQLFELGDPARREEIDARRHHLAELDEGRAELLQRHAHALRGIERDLLGNGIAVQDLPGAFQHARDADALHELAQAVADEDRGDFLEARQLAHHADGVPQHGRG